MVVHYLSNHQVAGWNRLPHSLLYRECGRGLRAANTAPSLSVYLVHDH